MKQTHILATLIVASVLPSQAASDLTNPLNTYVGNSQANFPEQPAFLAASGLDVSYVWDGGAGAWEKIDFFDTTAVSPQFPGARFGANTGGGATEGRNYLRTMETDYHTKSFTAFVTVRRTNANAVAFFGLGAGQLAGFSKSPDRGSSNASAYVELQDGFPNASRRVTGDSIDTEAGYNELNQLTSPALRMRLQYSSTAQTITYTFDYDYDGIAFQEDQILPTFSVAAQAVEWFGGDRASIYFGGDRSVVFSDLVITTASAPAPAPTGLQVASVANATATISWPAGVAGATYSVYRSETSGAFTTPLVTGLTTNTYTDSPLSNGTPYYYVITQTRPGSLESTFSNEVTATPIVGVLPPTGLVALKSGSQALLVDWEAPTTSPDTYKLFRSTDGVNFSLFASNLTESKYFDEAVVNGATYYYFVKAVLAGNDSSDSNTAQATPNPLEIFVDFNSGAVNTGRGALGAGAGQTWNNDGGDSVASDKLNDSTGVVTSVGIGGGSAFGVFGIGNGAHVGGTPATLVDGFELMADYRFTEGVVRNYTFTGLVPNRSYDLYLFGHADGITQNSAFNVGGTVKQTTNPTGLTALAEGRHYLTYSFVAESDGSFLFRWGTPGDLGLTDANPGGGSGFNGFQLVENESAVLQPTGLTASSDLTGVTLSWNEVEATDYKIYRSTTPAFGYEFLNSSGGNSNFTDTTGIAGITYYYVVTGVNVVGASTFESFFSLEVSGMKEQLIADADLDGLSDTDELLLGTNPTDAADFFKAQTSAVALSGGNFNVSFTINGAPGTYVIERSTSLLAGSWTEIPGSIQNFSWNTGTVLDNPLNLSAPQVTPASGGKEFFRAKGIAPAP
jgi:fibronectin type 3 domain-containing protein